MIYHFLYPLSSFFIGFNVFRYITFRTIGATLTALVLSLLIGPWLIRKLKAMEVAQPVREDVPLRHRSKEGTPTMGGLLIIVSTIGAAFLWARLDNPYVWLVMVAIIAFAVVGFLDDFIKVKVGKGISGKVKLLLQTGIALGIVSWIHHRPEPSPWWITTTTPSD